jgi:hypothetical protein
MKKRRRPQGSNTLPPGYAPGRGPASASYACPAWPANEPQNGFLRGAIAAGLLAAATPEVCRKDVLRRALQGGTAMAAGIAGANAIDQHHYGSALLALAFGAAGLSAIDVLLSDSQTDKEDFDE